MKWLKGSEIALVLSVVCLLVAAQSGRAGQQGKPLPTKSHAVSITVLYDNYTLTEGLRTDWGFACMIKGTEKNILFDTGTNGSLLLENMDKLQVRAADVELVVISHNHGDHTGGLHSFLSRNSNVLVYLPTSVSPGSVQSIEGTGATVLMPDGPVRIGEGVHLTGPMGTAVVEQALVLDTPKGLVVITGCAHPGILAIVTKAKQMLEKDVYLVLGGFHLLNHSDSQIQSIIQQFRNLGVLKVGATHCTGDRPIELLREAYGEDFVPTGVGRISIPNVCEFTGDGVVNFWDFAVWASFWRIATGEPGWDAQIDMGPPLFGDGTVDFQDLPGFVEYWLLEIGLVAHWPFDETEGNVAHDSAGENHGTLDGDPVWQPVGGKIRGALHFDETDDYVGTPFVLNPADDAFSIFAWVKGGAPGQVIVSQIGGANWLLADPSEGKLMTSLSAPAGRFPPQPLTSESVITDGDWHRVGFTWDGSNRILYVDDVEVGKDTQSSLTGSEGGLYIGVGKNREAGSFFSGLIDDVKIYDRAATP